MGEAYDVEGVKALFESQAWAKDWPHSIVPPGKPAHELTCEAIRALPALLARIAELEEALGQAANTLEWIVRAVAAGKSLSGEEMRRAKASMRTVSATLERAQAEGEGK